MTLNDRGLFRTWWCRPERRVENWLSSFLADRSALGIQVVTQIDRTHIKLIQISSFEHPVLRNEEQLQFLTSYRARLLCISLIAFIGTANDYRLLRISSSFSRQISKTQPSRFAHFHGAQSSTGSFFWSLFLVTFSSYSFFSTFCHRFVTSQIHQTLRHFVSVDCLEKKLSISDRFNSTAQLN